MKKTLFVFVIFVVLAGFAGTSDGGACYLDNPDCPCFIHTGAWDPDHGVLTEVARQTVGTENSCYVNPDGHLVGGKPFWQMCNGVNSPDVANCLGLFEDVGWLDYDNRVFWCSEAVSYWHREARMPYEGGYTHPGDIAGWCLTNSLKIIDWYKSEQALGGRGRWVAATSINYDDFRPGINAPCPGAFIAINKCTISGSGAVSWDPDKYHSLIVDDMTIHKDINHKIYKVELDFIEGNSSYKVKVDTSFQGDDDVLSYTPQGSKWIGTNKKIMGFGIDLDSRGNAIMSKPVKVVDLGLVKAPPIVRKITSQKNETWTKAYKSLFDSRIKYWKLLKSKGGAKVSTNIPKASFTGFPSDRTPWVVPANPKNDYEITIDLQDIHPETATRLCISFDGFIPVGFKAAYLGNDKVFRQAAIPASAKSKPQKIQGKPMPMMFRFTGNGSGIRLRYLKLQFPKGVARENVRIVGLGLKMDEGPAREAIVDIQSSQ